MPVGNPTRRSQVYQKKAGWVSKSYKLKKELVEQFADACEKAGVSQAGQISEMMKAFIEEQNK